MVENKKYQEDVMKRLGLLCLLSLLFGAVSAGTVVRGEVKDGKGSAVGYATVAAEQSGAVVVAIAADVNGKFELVLKVDGNYTIEVSSVGYQSVKRDVAAVGKLIDLGAITLSEGVAVDAVAAGVNHIA